MKKLYKILIIILFAITTTTLEVYAQAAPPPPPSHDATGNEAGRGAPIGGGLFILLGLGSAYGGKKFYDSRKERMEE